MLQNGAVKVYSVDVGTDQLDEKLRNDPRVVSMEKTDIRNCVGAVSYTHLFTFIFGTVLQYEFNVSVGRG